MTVGHRRFVWLVLALSLVGLGLWFALARRGASTSADGLAAGAAAASQGVVSAAAGRVAAAASVPARGHEAGMPGADARAELARRMKADWCGFGAAERDRQTEAVYDKATATTGMIGMAAMVEVRETVGGQLMEETQAQVRQRWAQALAQRGDARALAVADYLETDSGDATAPAARARLQARARTSGDPMVTVLALQRPCTPGACANIEASQWSRLEPANLQAWLALLTDPAGRARLTHASYVLDRLAQEARYARSYQRELQALLLGLPQTEAPGLQNEAEIHLIGSLAASWPMSPMRPILDLCRGSQPDAGTVSRCERVAQLLWQQDDQLNRGLGLGVARAVVAARPAMRPQWEAQAREYEAVSEWSRSAPERVADEPSPQAVPPCGWQPEMRRMWHESLARGEWEALRGEMRKAGADAAALSARWRRLEGRAALDPPTAPRPASGPPDSG